MNKVFVGLGGNIGDSVSILKQAVIAIAALNQVYDVEVSGFYQTSPVSQVPQGDYVNAVCTFATTLSALSLLAELQVIERRLGKMPKAKDQPRLIDLDILLFGTEVCDTDILQLPHPRWQERLFVLMPLRDLVSKVQVGEKIVDLDELIKNCTTTEVVVRLVNVCDCF